MDTPARSTFFTRWRSCLWLAFGACAACMPSAFDDLTTQRNTDPSTGCGLDGGDGCATDGGAGGDPVGDGGAPDASSDAGGCADCARDGGLDASAPRECMSGQSDRATEPCGACKSGVRTRTRRCDEDGRWGAWSAWGECTGVTATCEPGDKTACTPSDQCGHRVCNARCEWGPCEPIYPDGCLSRRTPSQVEGSNFRCCGAGGAPAWQFCLPFPDCRFSDQCKSCSTSAPDWCDC